MNLEQTLEPLFTSASRFELIWCRLLFLNHFENSIFPIKFIKY